MFDDVFGQVKPKNAIGSQTVDIVSRHIGEGLGHDKKYNKN